MSEEAEVKLDVNKVINSLLDQISLQARENAMLKAQLSSVASATEPEEDDAGD